MVSKQKAELLRRIKACKDVLENAETTEAVKAAKAEEMKALLVEMAELNSAEKINQLTNGGNVTMNEKLAIVAINKALRGIQLTDEERTALRNDATPTGQQGGVDAKGGYLCPKEFVADVERLADEDVRLKNYVHVHNTTFRKGSYPIRDEAATGLTKRAELTTLTAKDITFGSVEYEIENWYDFIPVSDEVAEDANVDMFGEVREAFAEDLVMQENKEILAAMDSAAGGSATEIEDYKGITNALYTGIKSAARRNAVIVTNQSGLAYLGNLEDGMHRPLLVPDITQPDVMRFKGCEVVVLSNTDLANGTTTVDEGEVTEATVVTIPFYVGDLKKAVLFADLEGFIVKMSKEAGFLQGAVYLKITPRFDVVKKFSNVLKKLALVTDEVVTD